MVFPFKNLLTYSLDFIFFIYKFQYKIHIVLLYLLFQKYIILAMKNKTIIDCLKEHIDTIYNIDKTSSCYNWTKNMFLEEIENKNSFFKVLYIDKIIAGYIIYHIVIDEAEILNIVIDNKFKRQKLGKYLLEQTINDISQKNIKTIFLEVGEKNIPAINLYLQFGLKQYNIRKNYYKNGENAILMKKSL